MKGSVFLMAAVAALAAVADGRAAAVPEATRPAARALDLSAVRNRSWRDSETVRGWNATPGCVAPDAIPDGRMDAFGIPFAVVNGHTAGGKDLVLLSAEGLGGAPRRISVSVPKGTEAGALALLHAAGRAARPGTPHGHIRFVYADGSTNRVPVISGTDISDWWMGAGGTNAVCAYRQGDAPQPMRVFASVFPLPERKPLAAVAFEVGDSPGALWMIGAATLLKEPVRLPDWQPPRKPVYPASSKAVIRQTPEGVRFENPVIRRNWSDPTVWTDGGRWYSAATGLEDTLASGDMINWTSLGRAPVPEEERRKAAAWTTSTSFWAPDVVKIGGRWLLYCTVMESSEKNRIAAFAAERPEGPFAFRGFVRDSEGTGIPDLCVDPEVVVDARGDVWLFSGSIGGIHRGRLTADGLRPLPGSRLERVTADGIEGGYLFRRGGWWYLFGSTGHYNDWTYSVNVVRSRTLDGVFANRAGEPATAGRYEKILASSEGDEIDGPGHNGEIFTLFDGRTYMFYHAHRRKLMPRPDESIQVPRPTCLQEVFWDADGWPRFTDGKPQLLERLPCAEKPLFANPVISPNGPDPTVWDGGDGWFYALTTPLAKMSRSRNLTDWEDVSHDPLTPSARAALTNVTSAVWAPCVVKLQGKWLLYVSLFVSNEDCRIPVLASDRPDGPFSYVGMVIDSREIGILNTIDPCVREADGRVWMFFGSCQDGVHRVELARDGLSMKPGAKIVHVAGRRNDGTDLFGAPGCWEGAYVLPRHGAWWLFLSGGRFDNGTYHLLVGRAETIDGTFRDREGNLLTAGLARPILSSAPGDRFTGPGHNGDVFTDADGRDWMFFHAHDAALPDALDRPMLLQELRWGADGWPCFEEGRPQPLERRPKLGGTEADIQRVIDASAGGTAVVPPGVYDIGATVFVPSDTKLVLKGCRLRMRDGAVCPMFRNRTDAHGDARNIVIDGGGTAVLDGGLPNGLDEFTSGKDGRPHVSENLTLFFTGVEGFSVTGLTVRDQRWWALMFLECANGRIADITFELTRHAQDSYARWRNQDGIDLRVGCHDIVIENIRGETGDDFIALTALDSPWFERRWARPGCDRAIRDIAIRHVKGRTNQCALIRLLSHFGQPIHHVTIEDVVEDSVPGRHNQSQMAVRIGDRLPAYYGDDARNAQRFGDIHDIRIDGLATRALSAVHTDDGVRNLTVRNVRLFGDAGSVWTGGTFGLDIAPFIYLPAREGEVRRSTLTPGKMEEWGVPRTDTVRLENVLFDGVAVEAEPHNGEALFRFRRAELVNCRVRNCRASAGRKMCDGDPRGTLVWERGLLSK